MNIFEFTEEDLTLNKRGLLSPRQKEWLGMTARGILNCSWTSALVAIFFLVLGLGMTLALYLQNERSRAALFSNPLNLIVFPATALIVLFIIAFSVMLARKQANRLQNAALSSASGIVRLDYDSSGNSGLTSYYVFVGKQRFTFADDMSAVFKEGQNYKVYYSKSRPYEMVLSYEQLG